MVFWYFSLSLSPSLYFSLYHIFIYIKSLFIIICLCNTCLCLRLCLCFCVCHCLYIDLTKQISKIKLFFKVCFSNTWTYTFVVVVFLYLLRHILILKKCTSHTIFFEGLLLQILFRQFFLLKFVVSLKIAGFSIFLAFWIFAPKIKVGQEWILHIVTHFQPPNWTYK